MVTNAWKYATIGLSIVVIILIVVIIVLATRKTKTSSSDSGGSGGTIPVPPVNPGPTVINNDSINQYIKDKSKTDRPLTITLTGKINPGVGGVRERSTLLTVKKDTINNHNFAKPFDMVGQDGTILFHKDANTDEYDIVSIEMIIGNKTITTYYYMSSFSGRVIEQMNPNDSTLYYYYPPDIEKYTTIMGGGKPSIIHESYWNTLIHPESAFDKIIYKEPTVDFISGDSTEDSSRGVMHNGDIGVDYGLGTPLTKGKLQNVAIASIGVTPPTITVIPRINP